MKYYRKRPVIICAEKYIDGAIGELLSEAILVGAAITNEDGTVTIKTLEGDHLMRSGDYLISGIKGELYPCKPDIFEATYELVQGV